MRFQVPQFIETEEKLIGPFTLKQFIFIAIGGAILFFVFFAVPPSLFLVFANTIGIIFLVLALAKIDEIPIYLYLAYFLGYILGPRRYIYKPGEKDSL